MGEERTDPRVEMGYEVEPEITGPYEVRGARDTGGDAGGTLDRGIIARTMDGRRIVIGEIWAACPGESGGKIRIDADAVAKQIVATLNAVDA